MTISKQSLIHYLLIYFLIISQGSAILIKFQNLFLVLCFGIGMWFILSRKWNSGKIDIYLFLVILLAIYLIFLSLYTGGSMSINSIGRIISILLLTYTVYYYDEYRVVNRFVKMVCFFSIISVLTFIVQLISPSILFHILPDYLGTGKFYGGLITTVVREHITRCCGLATEPGRHQIYLNAALFFALFRRDQIYCEENKKNLITILLIITLLVTQSTTGYLTMIVMVFFFLTMKNKKNIAVHEAVQKLRRVVWTSALGLIVYTIIGGLDTFIYKNLVTKLFVNGRFDLFQNTGSARMDSIITDLTLAFQYPMGMGFRDYGNVWPSLSRFHYANSCSGMTIFIATCGFIGFLLIIFIYLQLLRDKGKMEKAMLLLILVNVSLGQPSFYYAPMILMCMVKTNNATIIQNNL